jgi:hypothetical protein
MNCMDWEERIALYAGGDASADVEQHLAECDYCRDFCDELRSTLATLREEHSREIDAAHFTAVRAGVIAEIERGRKAWRRLAWVSGVGIAAALLLGIALRPAPLPSPPPRVAISIPQAPLTPRFDKPAESRLQAKSLPHKGEPIVVKLQTADPNIVIYWIAD